MPLVAVLVLNASPGQVGLLGVLATVAFLLIGLPAGAWVDRVRRRWVMVAADVARAVLLGSVPVAWWLDRLSLQQLYLVVLLTGVSTVFFDIANQSYLPHVVGRDQLMAANSALGSLDASTQVAGRSVGGYLVQVLTAPVAIGVDAASYLWSAACVLRIRRPEPRPEPKPDRHLIREILEGTRYVSGHPVLRPIALAGACTNFSVQLSVTMLPLVFTRELGLSGAALGLFLAVGGVGVFLGALAAPAVGRRFGQGRALWIMGIAVAPVSFGVPLIGHGGWLLLAGAAWLVLTVKIGMDNVIQVSFRQRSTPERLLGRMNATMRFLLTGALAIGAGVAGLLGQFVGVRAALWVSAVGIAVVWLPIFFSPLRTMRELPE